MSAYHAVQNLKVTYAVEQSAVSVPKLPYWLMSGLPASRKLLNYGACQSVLSSQKPHCRGLSYHWILQREHPLDVLSYPVVSALRPTLCLEA